MEKIQNFGRIEGMLPVLRKIPVLQTIHWAAARAMKQAGYQWELRRNGELKIGLWRKKLRAKPTAASGGTVRRMVLVPGFGDTSMSWIGVLPFLKPSLKKNYDEIVLVDFPGYAGFLAQEKAFPTMELLKNHLFDVLDSLTPHTIMGHSLGGWLTTLYAVECEEGARPKMQATGPNQSYKKPESLVLVSPSGVFSGSEAEEDLRGKFQKALDSEEGFKVIRGHVFHREPFWISFVAKNVSHFFKSPETISFIHSFNDSHRISEERLEKITSKVWLLWGEKDTLVPPTSLPIFLRKLNQDHTLCRAILLKNTGHSPQMEAPATLAVVLSKVLLETAGEKTWSSRIPASSRFWKLVEEC